MQSLKAALDFFVTRVTQSVGVYTAVIGIFIYHVVFDKDFECTCKVQAFLCPCYMILPAGIIFVLLLWLDGSFQVLLKYTCLKRTRFCCFLWLWTIRAIFISLLWPISVMIDGDWYTCCSHEKILNCTESNQTAGDQMSIEDLKIKSRIIGFGALLGIVFLAACLCFPWKECCTRQGLKECCTCQGLKECCCCCFKESDSSTNNSNDDLFIKIVLEEGEILLTKKLKEVAKGKIDEKIDKYAAAEEWEKCCGVLKEIIGQPPSSRSRSAEERRNGSGDETEPIL